MWFIIHGLAVCGALNWIQTVSNYFLSEASRFWLFDVDNAHQMFNLSILHYLEHAIYQEPLICGFVWINDCAGLDFEMLPKSFSATPAKEENGDFAWILPED
jgi:hypothetical protein